MPTSFVGVAAPDHKGRDAVPLPAPANPSADPCPRGCQVRVGVRIGGLAFPGPDLHLLSRRDDGSVAPVLVHNVVQWLSRDKPLDVLEKNLVTPVLLV